MDLVWISVLILLCRALPSLQNQYKLMQEDLEIEYVDERLLDIISVGLTVVNDSIKVLNITGVIKIEIPEDFKVTTQGFKSIHNQYRLPLFHYDTTLTKGLEMEYFDLQELFLKYTTPPLFWPLRKNVPYHTMGWTPNYNKWLPNFPAGKWKFQLTYAFANNTKTLVVNWFFQIKY